MKQCPTCQQTYPNDYAVCPRDSTELLEVSLWREGTIIKGKYRILGKLGEGGMGAVYKALHLRFNEVRALKVMNPDLARKPGFVERFQREAVVARRLQHRNAVRVDDIDEAEDGSPFIVMEFVEGRSLNEVIHAEAPLPWSRVCSIIKQVAAALDAAHQLGMVHRDIKPENIVLVEGPSGEQAKVLDFGIAKLKEERGGAITGGVHTATGTVLGTPQYMSPEQAKGMPGDGLDGRSDLYSLGMVMYEMLTGALPFKGDTTAAWILAHLQTVPTPVTTVIPHLQIPDSLASLVMQLLEKDRERRPPSGAALIAAIQRVEEKEPSPAGVAEPVGTRVVPREEEPSEIASEQALPQPTATIGPASMPSPLRWKARIVTALLAFLGLVGGIAYFYSRSVNVTRPSAAPARQPTLIESMARVWDSWGKGFNKEGPGDFETVRKLHPNAVSELRNALRLQPQKAELHFYLATLLLATEKQQAQAIEEFREGLRLKPQDALAHFWLGTLLQDDNDRLAEFNEAVRLKPDFADAHWQRGNGLLDKGDLKGAIADIQSAIRLNPKRALQYSSFLASDLVVKGNLKGAIAVTREAVRANPSDPKGHNQLAHFLLEEQAERKLAGLSVDQQGLDELIAETREAVRLKPEDPSFHRFLGTALGLKGDLDGEIGELREAIHLQPDDPSYHFWLAFALKKKGNESEAAQQEAIAKGLSSKAKGAEAKATR